VALVERHCLAGRRGEQVGSVRVVRAGHAHRS
jgi:hypothetical protein